jgi:hypothetical protein
LWQAESIDHAIELAEAETEAYAADGDAFLHILQAYALYDEIPASGVEVFSLLRESNLEPQAYVDAFFDTGAERSRKG